MLELLMRVEEIALEAQLEPLTLLIIGIVTVGVGLCLWLGGMRYSSFVIGILGAMIGSFLGMMVSNWTGIHPAICALVGAGGFALLALQFKGIIVIVISILLFATASGTGYMTYSLDQSPEYQQKLEEHDQRLDALLAELDSFDASKSDFLDLPDQEEVKQKGAQLWEKLKQLLNDTWSSMSPDKWKLFLWIVLGGIGGFILIWFIKKAIMAFCYSTVGTAATICGFQILLMAKGTAMMKAFENRPNVLPIILMGMIVFGWLFQLIFLKSKKKKVVTEEKVQKGKD